MADLGQFSLILAVFLCSYAILVDILAAWRRDSALARSARNATVTFFICLTTATIALWVLLLTNDFSVKYVAQHVARALPLPYKISALWAGASGSLLFWLWLQVGFVCMVFFKTDSGSLKFTSHARAIANLAAVFFLMVLVMDKKPFTPTIVVPPDGAGLNPLLQHPAMVLHPPLLFVGYAAFIIPMAWAFGFIKTDVNSQPAGMLQTVRRWTLLAWGFLTAGIVLGAWWAYEELGWGGYWAWDPVENSSLMPWFTATALLHCYRYYGAKTPMAMWTVLLAILTFSLCVFGTFLTRYGLVSSVHAFPEPGMGKLFIILLVHIWVIAAVAMFRRSLREDKDSIQPLTNAQEFVILNNYLMLLFVLVVFVGTLFPVFSGLFSDNKISLKPEYFNKITAPGGLALLLFIGMCPHLIKSGLKRSWRLILSAIVIAAIAIVWFATRQFALIYFIASAFVFVNLLADIIAYEKARSLNSSPRNFRWYGTRITHLGVLLIFIGIAASGGYGREKIAALTPGQKTDIADYQVTYNSLNVDYGPNFVSVNADILVERKGRFIANLKPAKAFYSTGDNSTSEVAIRRTLLSDFYVALVEVDNNTELINLKILIKPLINWIWIGACVLLAGVVMVVFSLGGLWKTM
jgi:cytochrome c-type biogenesis protein CcmF